MMVVRQGACRRALLPLSGRHRLVDGGFDLAGLRVEEEVVLAGDGLGEVVVTLMLSMLA